MTVTALLFATAPALDGGPAAALHAGDETLLRRLLGQLAGLGVTRACVVTRPALADGVRTAAAGTGDLEVDVVASPDLPGDLRAVGDVARRERGRLVVGRADVLTHREALAGLLADPRVNTGILTTGSRWRGRWAFRTRSQRGRVVAAGSPYHRLRRPTGFFLGFLKVDERDRAVLATAADRLAELAADPPAHGWAEELDRKVADWRRWQWVAATEAETGAAPEIDEAPAEPSLRPEDEALLAHRLAVCRDDAPSLLLVGLVRGGVHVANSYLRGFFYARPVSRAAAAADHDRMAEMDEDRVLLSAAVKGSDGFFTTYFVSPYSRYIARFAARRGWTPNAMTTVSMLIGAAAATFFALGSRAGLVTGAVLLQAAFTIDCVDGQLARYTRTFSKLGAWLDSIFDRGKEYLVYAGLALGSVRGFDDDVWILAACALALQTARHAVDFSYAAVRQQSIAATPQLGLEEPDEVPRSRRQEEAAAPAPTAAPSASAARAAAAAPAGAVALSEAPVAGDDAPPPEDDPVELARRQPGLKGVAARGVGLVTALDRRPATRWAKRIFSLPIGERFALISITAAIWSPQVTFTALLVWGAAAAAYGVTGRLLRSVAT
jgi:phosphatidylglycerophosphate synthase